MDFPTVALSFGDQYVLVTPMHEHIRRLIS